MSTSFLLLEKDDICIEASEESSILSLDIYSSVTGDEIGSTGPVITMIDLKILIDRLQNIYDMDTLF